MRKNTNEEEKDVNAARIAAIALIAAGILGLVYGGFSFTRETHEASIGPVEISVEEKQNVNIPIWAGVGAIVVGGALFFLGRKKS